MTDFIVNNMTCGHCVATVTNAIKRLDPEATVKIDLPTKQVNVDSEYSVDEISQVLEDAGYKPSMSTVGN